MQDEVLVIGETKIKESNISIRKTLFFMSKRFFDILCSLIGLIMLIPITIIIKICYMVTGDFAKIQK